MKKRIRFAVGAACVAALALSPWTVYAQAGEPAAQKITEKEVTEMADRAVALLNQKGDEALAIIGAPQGDFHKGELYAFVYDENVTMLAHPENPSLVGQNLKDKPDVKGKKFRNEIVEKALAGGGWTEYYYQKPNTTGIYLKKVYSKLAEKGGKKYIVAVGMYVE